MIRQGQEKDHEKDLQDRRGLRKLRQQDGGGDEKTTGVKDAVVNFMALKMKVEFEDGADIDSVMQDVIKNCKVVEDDCQIFL